ncbi:hypothetical protein H2198_001559 [Neophaeococcomyces mojaviensis]|uniref:Uncharacterized protein n=1 Tax=Neophaeococcomyces mojaviensis TaxID=3383035 RepID=A0ACC3AHJ8_9EURO|nr:hypothetical protein H2198_001559 [Knufia sp. JES_112]
MSIQPLLRMNVSSLSDQIATPLRSNDVVSLHLKLGSRGHAVTLLHSYLLLLHRGPEPAISKGQPADETVPLPELATATFGSGTRLAVLNFQRQNPTLLATSPSGIADQDTITVLKAKIQDAGIDWDHPDTSFVAGTVHYSDGPPGTHLMICVSDRDVGCPDKELAELRTDSCGYFAAQYTAERYYHSDSGRRPTLVAKVVRDKEVLFSSNLDQAVFHAPVLAVIKVSLSEPSPPAPTSDDFTQVVTALKSALPPALEHTQERHSASHEGRARWLDNGTRKRIADLREDNERHDIEYLARLKPDKLTTPKVTTAVLAMKLSKEAAERGDATVPPEVFYALLATGAQQKFLSRDPSNVGLSNVTLKSQPALLLHQFGQLDPSVIKSSLKEATRSNVVPPIHWNSELAKAWERIRQASDTWVDSQPTVEDYIWTAIEKFLSSGQEDAVRKVLDGENYEGDVQGLINNLAAAFRTAPSSGGDSAESFDGARIPSGATKSQHKLIASLKAEHGAHTLASLSHKSLRHIVASAHPEQQSTSSTEHDVDAATTSLRDELEHEFPTVVFKSKLGDHIEHVSEPGEQYADATKSTSPTGVSLGHPSLGIDSHAVHHFLQENPSFDLRSGRLKNGQSNHHNDGSQKGQIAKVQRMFKLAPTFEKTSALLDHGLHSASQVAGFRESDFVDKLSASPAFTPSEAKQVHERASNIHLGTSLLATDLRSAANALLPTGLSSPLPPTKLQALNAQFPDIASLFSYGDICACADCMTVYSPSAYLVDVLEFLRFRGVFDSVGGPNNGKMARDVLLGRRPDLSDLDLSCDNTNVTLPVIDLVCELLEGFIAPDGLSPGVFDGSVDKGKISTDLLSFLREDLGLPFSESAFVSDIYNGGWRTVRDKTVVVSLSPASPYAVRVLRQTYGDSATLAASPAYVNYVAYDLLAESAFMPSLPFDLNLENCRGYLAQLGISREQLMKDLASPNFTYNAALEMLSLTDVAGTLITTPDPDHQDLYWNTGDPAGPVDSLQNVKMFLDAAQVEYTDLQALMNATEWLNPPEDPSTAQWLHRVGAMYIKHLDSSCTLAKKSIIGLDNPSLDRLHRFIRLWKSLKSSSGTWTISNLDRAIQAPRLGASDLNPTFMSTILTVTDMTSMLSSTIPTRVNDVIDLFNVLRPAVDVSAASTPDVTYSSLFLNAAAHGPIDPLFKLDTITLNDAVTPPTTIPQIDKSLPYVSACLGVAVSDLTAALTFATASAGNKNLTVENLSSIYAVVSLCNRLVLSIPDFLLFQKMSGLEPLKTIDQLKTFVTTVTEMQSLSLEASEVQLLTQPASNPRASNDIMDAAVTQLLTILQKQYAPIQSANKSPFDEQLSPDDNEGPVLALIAQMPQTASDGDANPAAISQIDLSQFHSMLEGNLTTTAAARLIQDKLQPTIGQDTAKAITQAQSGL